jgi:hypothetical protein
MIIRASSPTLLKKINFTKFNTIKYFKLFSEKSELNFTPNPDNDAELLIKVPKDLQDLYSCSNINQLPIFQCYSNFKHFNFFIPAHKFNFILFSIYTCFSYGTPLFQPSLLLTLYILNKLFLTNSRKISEVISISIWNDGTKLFVRSYAYGSFFIEISKVKMSFAAKLDNEEYYELKIPAVVPPLILDGAKGKFVDKAMVKELLSGKYEKVKFEYV